MHYRVRTPSITTAPERESLLRQLRQTLKQKRCWRKRSIPSLLGGTALKVGDWVYDASVRSRLRNSETTNREKQL